MNAVLTVAAFVVFSFAVAANVKKTQIGAKDKGAAFEPIPTCAEKDTFYKAEDIVRIDNVYNAGSCGDICSSTTTCQMWSYHQPRPGSQPTTLHPYACALKSRRINLTRETHIGIHSGQRGCSNEGSNQVPVCAEQNAIYKGGENEEQVSHGTLSASICGEVCTYMTTCGEWSYYLPTPGDSQPTKYRPFDCIFKKSGSNTTMERQHGFYSGVRGCK